jgi:hypothetical protein
MPTVEVLVIFYCRTGAAESLALAAAVGAVQARAHIRLRRLPDDAAADPPPEPRDELRRMKKEYTAPTAADCVRADAIIFVAPGGFAPGGGAEWRECFAMLGELQSEGKLAGKAATAVAETELALNSLSETISGFRFTFVPADPPDAASAGRRVALVAAALAQANRP